MLSINLSNQHYGYNGTNINAFYSNYNKKKITLYFIIFFYVISNNLNLFVTYKHCKN